MLGRPGVEEGRPSPLTVALPSWGGVAVMINKTVLNAVLGCNLKNDRMISACFQGKPFNNTVIKSMPQTVMLKELKLNDSMKT